MYQRCQISLELKMFFMQHYSHVQIKMDLMFSISIFKYLSIKNFKYTFTFGFSLVVFFPLPLTET